jgi:hypothetical protein
VRQWFQQGHPSQIRWETLAISQTNSTKGLLDQLVLVAAEVVRPEVLVQVLEKPCYQQVLPRLFQSDHQQCHKRHV